MVVRAVASLQPEAGATVVAIWGRIVAVSLLRYLVQGFGWRIGREVAEEAIDQARGGAEPPEQRNESRRAKARREKAEAREAEARAKEAERAAQQRARAAAEAKQREAEAIERELEALKRKIGKQP